MGLTTYLAPGIDSLLKVTAGPGGIQEKVFGRTLVGGTSRFVRNDWMDNLLGANFALFKDVQRFGGALAGLDGEKLRRKGMILLPYNTFFRLGTSLAEVHNK